ncbi:MULTISPECIES: NAD(P)/FAD-dependent oxidoreductase [Mesonia]|uniref:NADH dehydrogenase-like protein n=1 Tax=Mesonia oceanica TaxID=2687242 RepID=A0AC61Y988_9FLAO|nr:MULTISPECIES: NAD(P)/FAD-dependent oxidoreductase [Mesonia]MAN27795.1 FAD-dependent oxidoreductase [Mesonia sp.]MAQ40975.1 FAD-dependent oxidoreductase [Mesonia sp.]MBJ96485.1 FAD-dependent oxidoreductase [Flavobacteriaceae bacterium]VVV01067.1 NADH dehydrogenase-like protein [Mesonia oceanica]|tara:strand:- start:101671 stop:102942 length:1272 start_codon:yes stop_codon:yes gene_type:complete
MRKKIVIVGGGFAGVNVLKRLVKHQEFEITLVDKNNYNYFTPLIYQVATGFIEPSSISYPFRSLLSGKPHAHFWLGKLQEVIPEENKIILSNGELNYDTLILSTGTRTNYYGIENIRKYGIPMNSLNDALNMRNILLQRIEKATRAKSEEEKEEWLTMVIAGGGATGVEVSGMFAELRKQVILEEYSELKNVKASIYLVNSGENLLKSMSEKSQQFAYHQLRDNYVKIVLNNRVKDFNGKEVILTDDSVIRSRNLIWATGVKGRTFKGLPKDWYEPGNRLLVNAYHKIKSTDNIYVIGDGSIMYEDEDFPQGHPRLAQAAIQQGRNLAKNLIAAENGEKPRPFTYKDKGVMAVIGKSNAVADLPSKLHFKGFIALMIWGLIHLFSLIGRTDRIRTFLNWSISYFTKKEDLRMIIRPKDDVDLE